MDKLGRKRLNWEQTAIKLAFNIADYRSEDPFITVGACGIKKDGNSIILGYNGAPPNIEIDWSNRDERRKRMLHAEENVLNRVLPGELRFLAVTALPCDRCIRTIALKQVPLVIYSDLLEGYDNDLTIQLAKEFGIELKRIKNLL